MQVQSIGSSQIKTSVKKLAVELLKEVAADLQPAWGSGKISPSTYDTAWVAMVRHPEKPQELAFPKSLEWLLCHQSMNGSWSGPAPHSILPTLAALLALIKAPDQNDEVKLAAFRARLYLEKELSCWAVHEHESVAFELIAPGLLEELEKKEIIFNFPDKTELLKLRAQKLQLLTPDLFYSGNSNLIHSLEAFGSNLDFKRLKFLQSENGSYGCSPAATAAVLIYGREWDKQAGIWLNYLTQNGGSVPTAYSIDTFEVAWVLYNLSHSKLNFYRDFPPLLLKKLHGWLEKSLTEQGASISLYRSLPPDADDTAMVIAALNRTGGKAFGYSLLHFEQSDYFICFEGERDASVSANAHVLAAFLSLDQSEQGKYASGIKKVMNFLFGTRHSAGFWQDKWHLSPYYATASVVLALSELENIENQKKLLSTLEWVMQTQREDGGWGCGSVSTMEETAYALQILRAFPKNSFSTLLSLQIERALRKGIQFLSLHLFDSLCMPELWCGKELYSPYRVILSAVLSVCSSC